MAEAYYYVDDAGQQQGPVAVEEIVGFIRLARVRAETLIWTAGMGDWARADSPSRLRFGICRCAAAAAFARRGAARRPSGPLAGAFPAWGLFWRSIVMALGIILILPAPWAGVWFYRWFAGRVLLPGGRPLRLEAQVGDSWWLFVGLGVVQWVGPALDVALDVRWGGALSSILVLIFGWASVRWFCGHVGTEDGATKIAFAGGLLPYIGWSLLVGLSFVTVIGWAWAFKYFLRWICARIDGAPGFAFNGGGFAILWRGVVFIAFDACDSDPVAAEMVRQLDGFAVFGRVCRALNSGDDETGPADDWRFSPPRGAERAIRLIAFDRASNAPASLPSAGDVLKRLPTAGVRRKRPSAFSRNSSAGRARHS